MPSESPALRRVVFVLLCLAVSAGLGTLLWRVLASGGWTGWEVVVAAAYLLTLPWTAICVVNAGLGLAILLAVRDAPGFLVPQVRGTGPRLRTAIAVCVRNEDMAAVLPPLGRLLDGLEAAGEGERFTLWFLSDTRDPEHAAREDAAVAAFVAARGGGVPVRHRRRADGAGFKAGNVMEFLDNHAGGHELVVMLDADSEMSAAAVLRLVRGMEADPGLALIQQLIVGRPAPRAFPRLFQFGMRAGMRAWATGQGWWQLDDGPYWGHNAVFRVAPFREHARLPVLPDGSAILSHDQVEAVLLHAAGWRVRCLPAEDGSLEGNPPALPEFLERDRRWGAGNMQYRYLIGRPGLRWMGRWQMAQAMLLFLTAPLWVVMLLAAVGNAVSGGGASTPMGALAGLLFVTWLCNAAPKLCGYAEVLIKREMAATYGGRGAFLRGAVLEIVFSLLIEPVSLINKTISLGMLALGVRSGWGVQNRVDRGVAWGDAARLLWPHTLVGVGCVLALASVSGAALLCGLPFLAGSVLTIPLCVWTAAPGVSGWLVRRRIAATPEELAGTGRAAQSAAHV
ncbi:glucans biosynthesis glucosyltransferase MdoH [Muricoccus radiodurans]|uniref:glucans biosynthesis glucosyltransferase MdoH n=1 Tax=Muricoccus radiodurans TaxID=2231721 RepID=UPI003CF944E0